MFHGQSTPYVEPRGELSSFYDEHSRVVHVHDPVRTIFDTSDARPAACGSFSDNAHALQPFKISKIFHNRVVLPAADVRKPQASACESEHRHGASVGANAVQPHPSSDLPPF